MAKKLKQAVAQSLANPIRLKGISPDDEALLQVIIETPKGSRNKYSFDDKQRVFTLKKVLPAGMGFPYDFGFVPGTLAEDGDPVDVLVLMDEAAFPGCLLECRLIGVIEGEQQDEEHGKIRNDRLIAVEQSNHIYSDLRDVGELHKKLLKEIEEFFVNYHRLQGKKYKVLGWRGPQQAWRLVRAGQKAA
jgi:inorganic pyrophosphatase